MSFDILRSLTRPADTKAVLLVMDGLGGLPGPDGRTELEAAHTPNLDRLAKEGICGLHVPVGPGMTPGSGPAHLGLFGYDPLRYEVGRGVLGALGIGFDLLDGDVAARGNFCTVDEAGKVTDRRAGRIPTEEGRRLCEKLGSVRVDGAQVFVEPVKEYRFLLVLRGDDLSSRVSETDPQRTGVEPRSPKALVDEARRTQQALESFLEQAKDILADEPKANMALLRGFSKRPSWPSLPDVYGIRAAAAAAYPMYRGAARLVGMEVLDAGDTFESELAAVTRHWDDLDYCFLHFKKTDSAGEDGDFGRKVRLIEEVDHAIPRLLELQPDVLAVTGDHSTPSQLQAHSWHPVPLLLWAPGTCRPDEVTRFGERPCLSGGLGPRMPAMDLMPLMMAHAGRLEKYGA